MYVGFSFSPSNLWNLTKKIFINTAKEREWVLEILSLEYLNIVNEAEWQTWDKQTNF